MQYQVKLLKLHGLLMYAVIDLNSNTIVSTFHSEYSAIIRANKLNNTSK